MDPDGSEDPHRDAHPDVFQIFFMDWCQDQVARITMQDMRPADYRIYARLVRKFKNREISYEAFWRLMGQLLQNPSYGYLRVWWNVYHGEVTGAVQMVDSPLFRFPLYLLMMVDLLVYVLILVAPSQNVLMIRAAQWVLEQSRSRDLNRGQILGPEAITDEEDSSTSSNHMNTESD